MTAVPPDLQRKVRQLDNDVQSIYEMLATIQATQQRQGNRLDELATDVGSLKSDVGSLKSDVGALKSDVVRLRTEQGAKLDAILEHLRGHAATQAAPPDGEPA
jgi:outer membrane murein-binding lipoprotein Lpp